MLAAGSLHQQLLVLSARAVSVHFVLHKRTLEPTLRQQSIKHMVTVGLSKQLFDAVHIKRFE